MTFAPPDAPLRTLIDDLLAEQQELTAIERFSRKHEHATLPAQARYYRDLIPIRKPATGEQYAFGVDLDACTGCKACVSACHSLNGLDEEETWRDVGVIYGGTVAEPYQQTVTTACHHCADPGCLSGCPVMAYEKDSATGIVRHLDDQCIGCEYCMLKCPYDVPKYSKKRGIVRKCDMCYNRLAVDEAPACVQACPNEAITIRIANIEDTRAHAQPGLKLIHGAFESSYTKPTTIYTTKKAMPANAEPGDIYRLRLEHPHWPLISMLLLSQISAGVFVVLGALVFSAQFERGAAPLAVTGFIALHAGLMLSVFHLGRPLKAWRFFLGLRTSWMSREILVFGMFAGISAPLAIGAWWPWIEAQASRVAGEQAARLLGMGAAAVTAPFPASWQLVPMLAVATAGVAVAAIFCSAMIYVDTRRPFWSAANTFPKFCGTTLLLGLGASAAVLSWLQIAPQLARTLCGAALVANVLYAGWNLLMLRHNLRDPSAPAHRSARTIWKLLRPQLAIRAVLVVLATVIGIAAVVFADSGRTVCATLLFLLTFGSAIIERYCFFTASDAPRMPGGIAA
jgi:formate dehydrogenase iron-sulfur subunit